jgi:hypothetical protein
MHTCIPHTCIPAYLHTCIPAYLHTSIPAYLHTCIPAYLHTCIPAYRIQHTAYCIQHTAYAYRTAYRIPHRERVNQDGSTLCFTQMSAIWGIYSPNSAYLSETLPLIAAAHLLMGGPHTAIVCRYDTIKPTSSI